MIGHRDALQAMIDKKPGKLADLLEIEQALAQAQASIDSRQSLLAALKLRVSMSVLTFSYQAEYAPASQSDLAAGDGCVRRFAPHLRGQSGESCGSLRPCCLCSFRALGNRALSLRLSGLEPGQGPQGGTGRRRRKGHFGRQVLVSKGRMGSALLATVRGLGRPDGIGLEGRVLLLPSEDSCVPPMA